MIYKDRICIINYFIQNILWNFKFKKSRYKLKL